LPGTAVEMKVTIFHIENITSEGVTIKDIGIARVGDFVVRKADPDLTYGAAQFRIKEIRQSQDGEFQAQVEKFELLASFVRCIN